MQNSSVSLLTAVVTAIIVFLFAVAWVTAKAALNTLRTAKNSVGPARKTFWSMVGRVIKIGVWLVVLIIALVAWQAGDIRNADERKPVPSPSVSRR
jgi:hypothetical protein